MERERDALVLTFEERRFTRGRRRTRAGREIALALPTGTSLVPGAVVAEGADYVVVVEAAEEPLLAALPRDRDEAVRVAFEVGNRHGARMHTWCPLTIAPGTTCATKVVLVDTRHLSGLAMVSTSPPVVRVGTGAGMEALLAFLEAGGFGLTATPAPGDLTVGGVLAIDGHGTGIPAQGEARRQRTYGSVSNRVLSLTAVVWDAASGQYALRTFARTAPEARALLVHLGRTIVTEVTLAASPNDHYRCQSYVHVPASEMFAAPGAGGGAGTGRTFASYVESAGRVEAIWFPFTAKPWLKVWSIRPSKPLFSRRVTRPYNYPFSDNISFGLANLLRRIITGEPRLTPFFGQFQYDLVAAGLVSTWSFDIWGPSKNTILYVKPTTLRVHANGYAILTRRANIQRVVAEFVAYYTGRLAAYRARGLYPMNGPLEVRVTGLDDPAEVAAAAGAAGAGAVVPTLSALAPRQDHPEWDVAVWLDILTSPGTPGMYEFYDEVEDWVFRNYTGSYAMARVEWSKGWGYSSRAAWDDPVALGQTVPESLRVGRPPADGFDAAVQTLDALDPHRVFTNPFLDALLR